MLGRMTFQTQLFLALHVALLLGWVYQPTSQDPRVSGVPSGTPIPVYQNLPGGWKILVRFHRNAPPEILSISRLEQIRLATTSDFGAYSIRILDVNAQELFVQKFQVYFLRTGSSEKLDVVERILLIPRFENVVEIVIITPQGETRHAITEE